MKRGLLNLLTALSLLLCVAVAALWIRGYWASDLIGYVAARSDGGRLAGWVCSPNSVVLFRKVKDSHTRRLSAHE